MHAVFSVLRRKFSASNFWKDCIENDCTSMVYVGEVCRFLVNQPPSSLDKKHKIRLAIGNGLRENVWKEFNERFSIKCKIQIC
jgi:solute carrier family 27 fatty acid transporter 1/4